MNWRTAIPFVATVILLVGCVGQRSGTKIAEQHKAYANIVSLSPSTTEILTSGGGATYLVGRTASCDRPNGITDIPIVAGVKPDYEAIMATDPDLIIYDTMLYNDDDIALIESYGIETLAYDADTIEEFIDFSHRLAAKIGLELQMSKHVDMIYRAISAAQAVNTGEPRTTIMMGSGGAGDYLVMGDSGMHSAVIEAAGGKVVGTEGRLFQPMNIERLIDLDPEIIFTDGSANEILNDPRLQGISAVKEQYVYDVEPRTLVRISGQIINLITDMNRYITSKPKARIREGA